jgi:hypothetical protein
MGKHGAIGQKQGVEIVSPVHCQRRAAHHDVLPVERGVRSVMSALVVKVAAGVVTMKHAKDTKRRSKITSTSPLSLPIEERGSRIGYTP